MFWRHQHSCTQKELVRGGVPLSLDEVCLNQTKTAFPDPGLLAPVSAFTQPICTLVFLEFLTHFVLFFLLVWVFVSVFIVPYNMNSFRCLRSATSTPSHTSSAHPSSKIPGHILGVSSEQCRRCEAQELTHRVTILAPLRGCS